MRKPRLQGQPMKLAEEWDANKLLRAKAAWRKGASLQEVKALIGSALSDDHFRKRARQHGMRWSQNVQHEGGGALMTTAPLTRL